MVYLPVYQTGVTLNELPDNISFYIQLANCQIKCKGCHSFYLWDNVLEWTTLDKLSYLCEKGKKDGADSIILFGDINNGINIDNFKLVCNELSKILPLCIYSGADTLTGALGDNSILQYLSYIKLGHFDMVLGGLRQRTTNQRLYKVLKTQELVDITDKFWR